jgi:hypothetical protein
MCIRHGGSYNLILNCDACYNFDPPVGGNADGFSPKWEVGPGNLFKGCRAFNNSDDGWDLWMGQNSVIMDSCYSFRNGVDSWHTGSVNGNGDGFKLGGDYVATPHTVHHCVSFDNAGNTGRGYDENNDTAGQTLYNCVAYRNTGDNYHFTNNPITGLHIFRNCISFQGNVNIRNDIDDHNSWDPGGSSHTPTAADFVSIDTALASAPRNADGSLADNGFFRLVHTSPFVDAGVYVGYSYLGAAPDLGAFEFNPLTVVNDNSSKIPKSFSLNQNYPNPFNPSTVISYQLSAVSKVTLKVYDILGKEIASLVNEEQQAGSYNVTFNASNLSSGIYFYTLKTDNFTQTRKMILIK